MACVVDSKLQNSAQTDFGHWSPSCDVSIDDVAVGWACSDMISVTLGNSAVFFSPVHVAARTDLYLFPTQIRAHRTH